MPPQGTDQDLTLVHEATVDMARDLHLESEGTEIFISFETSLHRKARVKVEAVVPEQVRFELRPDFMKFSREEDGDVVRVTLVLPPDFDDLKAEFKASLCRVNADIPLAFKDLQFGAHASSCTFDMNEFAAEQLRITTNAGKTEFKAKKISAQRIAWTTNAGAMEVELGELSWTKPDSGENRLRFEVATGQGKLKIGKSAAHSIHAACNMGKLAIKQGGEETILSGLLEEKTIEVSPNAPQIHVSTSMGQLDLEIDEIVAHR